MWREILKNKPVASIYARRRHYINLVKKNDKIKKSLTLFSSMTLSIFIGIIVSILNTRYLGKERYGDFKFLVDIFNFFVTFLVFGFFYTGGRLLAKTNDINIRKKIFGEIITLSFIVGVILMFVIFFFSFIQPVIFENNLQKEIWTCIPFLFVLPMQLSLEQLLQGDNKIYSLSVMRIGPKILYCILILGLYLIPGFNIKYALIAHLSSFILIYSLLIYKYRPTFSFQFSYLGQLWSENKTYGFPVYLGAISGVASSYLAGISISYFIDNTNVGFYTLAITASLPLTMLPASFGISFFKEFINLKKIPWKINFLTFLIGFLILIVFLIFIKPIVILLYTKEFISVVKLTYFISVGSLFHGFGDFYNRFLSAKGMGKQLRDSNFILGGINIVGYFTMVYFFGVMGAAIVKLIAGISYLIIMVMYYKKYLKDN